MPPTTNMTPQKIDWAQISRVMAYAGAMVNAFEKTAYTIKHEGLQAAWPHLKNTIYDKTRGVKNELEC